VWEWFLHRSQNQEIRKITCHSSAGWNPFKKQKQISEYKYQQHQSLKRMSIMRVYMVTIRLGSQLLKAIVLYSPSNMSKLSQLFSIKAFICA
jgi:hypothetical protein